MNHLTTSIVQSSVLGVTPACLDDGLNPASNQTLQCPVVTIRCYPWYAGSWQVFHIVGLCVFSHQLANYSIVVGHLTSNSFEGHPCCIRTDYLRSLCFWYSPSYHAYWEWIKKIKTLDLNTQIRSVNILNFE